MGAMSALIDDEPGVITNPMLLDEDFIESRKSIGVLVLVRAAGRRRGRADKADTEAGRRVHGRGAGGRRAGQQ